MLDFHTHLLPNMDDGSDSIDTAYKILQMLAAQGVTQVVATPHFYAAEDRPDCFLQRREQSLSALEVGAGLPRILPGAEVAYFEGMAHCRDLQALTAAGTGLILVEMPFAEWTQRMVAEVVRLKTELGLQPVLAHVERYRERNQLPKFLKELAEAGVAMQCNAQAFLTAGSCRWAVNMVKKGYVQFLGTDTHNLTTRAPRYDEAVAVLKKKLPPELVAELTGEI